MIRLGSSNLSLRSITVIDFGRDGRLLLLARGIRMFAYGCLSVVLGLYLQELGYGEAAIGLLFTIGLIGSAVLTLLLTPVTDSLGRRRLLCLAAIGMVIGGSMVALTDLLPLLIIAAVVAAMSPSGSEVGLFLPLEQAALAQAVGDARRTSAFAWYHLIGSMAGALGALAVAAPASLGFTGLSGYRILIWAYAGAGLALFGLFTHLSSAVEAPSGGQRPLRAPLGLHRSRRTVALLSSLFALDAFAGGFVAQSFMALWFRQRFGLDAAQLGPLFFGINVCAAVSYLVAARLAGWFGLLHTMVFTHLLSNLLLITIPFMPTFSMVAFMLLVRYLLAQMDVPTRQSYTMAVVDPDERAAAAGLTAVARTAGAAVAPLFAGFAMMVPSLGLPFLIAGGLKSGYDLSLFVIFRGVRPPEESKEHFLSQRETLGPCGGGR